MTHSEAAQHSRALKRIGDLQFSDIRDWLALVDDGLRRAMPDNSQLLARFSKLKADAEEALSTPKDRSEEQGARYAIKSNCRNLLWAVCELLDSAPPPPEELHEEIDRIIQKGYFKSIYFRAVLGGLGLVLLLITGVGGFKITQQVEAMQRLLDQARHQVEQSSLEVSRARAEANDRQAQLALLILHGNAELGTMRINALKGMENAQNAFNSEVAEKPKRWIGAIEAAGSDANQKVVDAGKKGDGEVKGRTLGSLAQIDEVVKRSKKPLADKLAVSLAEMEATKHPWVPRVIWAMAKTWLLVPLALCLSLLGLLNTIVYGLRKGHVLAMVLSIGNAALLVAIVAFLARLS